RPVLSHLFKSPARSFRKSDDRFPIVGRVYRDDTCGSVKFLVGPETPTDVMSLKQLSVRLNPFIGVLARLAHPDRNIVLLTKVQILLNRFLFYRYPVFVKRVGELPIKGWTKDFEVAV